jgi:hypothetical protein
MNDRNSATDRPSVANLHISTSELAANVRSCECCTETIGDQAKVRSGPFARLRSKRFKVGSVRDPVIQPDVMDVRYCEKAPFAADFAPR